MNSIDYGILKTQYKSHLFYVDNHQNLNIIIIEIHMGVKGTTTTTKVTHSHSLLEMISDYLGLGAKLDHPLLEEQHIS